MARLDFGIALGLAYQRFTDELRAALARQGFDDLGRWYGYVFRALAAEELRLSTLAERLGMSAQGAAKIVDEMETRGYVERRGDPTDGRGKRLRLAPRGRRALAAARRFHRQFERRLGREISASSLATLRALLERLGGVETAGPGAPPVLRPL